MWFKKMSHTISQYLHVMGKSQSQKYRTFFFYDTCSCALEMYLFTRNIPCILNFYKKYIQFLHIFYLFNTLIYLFIVMQHMDPIRIFFNTFDLIWLTSVSLLDRLQGRTPVTLISTICQQEHLNRANPRHWAHQCKTD